MPSARREKRVPNRADPQTGIGPGVGPLTRGAFFFGHMIQITNIF